MYMSGYLGSIGPGPYGAINNPQNNPTLVAVVNAINSGGAKIGTYKKSVPVSSGAYWDTTSMYTGESKYPVTQYQDVNVTALLDANGKPFPGTDGIDAAQAPGAANIWVIRFPDPGSEGTVFMFVIQGANGFIQPIKDPSIQVKWQGGQPGGVLNQIIGGLAPVLKWVGPVLALATLGSSLLATGAVEGAAGAAAAEGASAAGASAVDYSLAAGMGSGIGVTIPAAIAAPVSSLADVTLGQGLVAAGTAALPSIGEGALGAGITIPSSIAAPVTSLQQIAAGQGLVSAAAPAVTPAVSSPIPSKVVTGAAGGAAPSSGVLGTGLTTGQVTGLIGSGIKAVTGGSGGGSGAGGGSSTVTVQRSPGAPIYQSDGTVGPVPTGAPSPRPSNIPATVNVGRTLAAGGLPLLLLGGAALFLLAKKGR